MCLTVVFLPGCVCSAEGTVSGGRCEDSTGSCQCKVNVEGLRCERCRRGYYGLSASNPLGCFSESLVFCSPVSHRGAQPLTLIESVFPECSCSPDGSLSDVCDPVTGQCPCRPHLHGLTCEACSKGYWTPFLSGRCEPCSCDPIRSYSDACDQVPSCVLAYSSKH